MSTRVCSGSWENTSAPALIQTAERIKASICEETESSAFLFLFCPATYIRNVWNASFVLIKVAGLAAEHGMVKSVKSRPGELHGLQLHTWQQPILPKEPAPAWKPAHTSAIGLLSLLHKAFLVLT